MRRTPCIIGRATTCWKAHPGSDSSATLVIKDSWQHPERDKEGELFCKITEMNVPHVARYYHHETIHLHNGHVGDVQGIRNGLDIATASAHPLGHSDPSYGRDASSIRGNSAAGQKRSSSQAGAPEPPSNPSKRSRSETPIKPASKPTPPNAPPNIPQNRLHRRIILCDYGKPIYKAGSLAGLLTAIKACIQGHKALYKAGFLYKDISINNLLITENKNSPFYPAFLINLNLAIANNRIKSLKAKGKIGIGPL